MALGGMEGNLFDWKLALCGPKTGDAYLLKFEVKHVQHHVEGYAVVDARVLVPSSVVSLTAFRQSVDQFEAVAWLGSVLLVVVVALIVVDAPGFLHAIASGIQKDLKRKIRIVYLLSIEHNWIDPFPILWSCS